MLVILSGEGPSDMGGDALGELSPGPMAFIVDRMIEERFDFSPLASGLVTWISRAELSSICKNQRLQPHMILPGARREAGYAGYTKHAAALAWHAKEMGRVEDTPCLAVMFRDSDGTQSVSRDHWEKVVSATEAGFSAMSFTSGVPMIPKPKQEAWLLCATKHDSYVHCHLIEEESGNDDCPNPLKAQLAEAFGSDPTTQDMCDWVVNGVFDISRVDMPSFNRFKVSMEAALDSL